MLTLLPTAILREILRRLGADVRAHCAAMLACTALRAQYAPAATSVLLDVCDDLGLERACGSVRATLLALLPPSFALRPHESSVTAAHFSPDGDRLLSTSTDGVAVVSSVREATPLLRLRHPKMVESGCFCPDGRRVATASYDGTARVWDATTDQICARLDGHAFAVFSVAYDDTGAWIVTAGGDGTARVWDATTGRCVSCLAGHQQQVFDASFGPAGRTVVTAGFDHTALSLIHI